MEHSNSYEVSYNFHSVEKVTQQGTNPCELHSYLTFSRVSVFDENSLSVSWPARTVVTTLRFPTTVHMTFAWLKRRADRSNKYREVSLSPYWIWCIEEVGWFGLSVLGFGIITQRKNLNILSCGGAVIKSSKSLLASRNYLISCWQVKGSYLLKQGADATLVRQDWSVLSEWLLVSHSLLTDFLHSVRESMCLALPVFRLPQPLSALLFSALSSPNFLKEQYMSNNNRTKNNSQKLYGICYVPGP